MSAQKWSLSLKSVYFRCQLAWQLISKQRTETCVFFTCTIEKRGKKRGSRFVHSIPNDCKGTFIWISCVLRFLRSLVLQRLMSIPLCVFNKSEKRALIILVSKYEWDAVFILLKWLIQCQVEDPTLNEILRGTIFLLENWRFLQIISYCLLISVLSMTCLSSGLASNQIQRAAEVAVLVLCSKALVFWGLSTWRGNLSAWGFQPQSSPCFVVFMRCFAKPLWLALLSFLLKSLKSCYCVFQTLCSLLPE